MQLLELERKKWPRVASTTGAVAEHLHGGVDMSERTCSIPECTNPHMARGWCKKHYARWRRNGDPTIRRNAIPEDSTLERILRRVDVGDCWLWQGAQSSGGYGRIGLGLRTYNVHRVIWEELVGPIPDGHEIDHLCRIRHCVNPDHLQPVPKLENIRRGYGVSALHMVERLLIPLDSEEGT